MTKLYCPKGHAALYDDNSYDDRLGKLWTMLMCNNSECYRPYFEIDCLTEPLAHDTNVVTKNSNSAEFDGIKTDGCEHDLEEIVFTYPRPGGVPGFQKGYKCKKCEFIPKYNPEELLKSSIVTLNQYRPDFKTESQIAVDRVVEALMKVRWKDDVDAVCNSALLDGVIFELEGLNK